MIRARSATARRSPAAASTRAAAASAASTSQPGRRAELLAADATSATSRRSPRREPHQLADPEQVADGVLGAVGRPREQQLAAGGDDGLLQCRASGRSSRLARSLAATQPRATASADGRPAGSRPSVVRRGRARRVTDARWPIGSTSRGWRQFDALDRHVGRRAGREQVGRGERARDRQRRVVVDLHDGADRRRRRPTTRGARRRRPARAGGSRRPAHPAAVAGARRLPMRGECHRSSAATCQSSAGEPSHGSSAPCVVTSARHGWPSTPVPLSRPRPRRPRAAAIGSLEAATSRVHAVRGSPSARVEAAVLIPVKRFSAAKGRSPGSSTPPQRAELARWLADRVVAAAAPLPTFVACDDDEVASLGRRCRRRGAVEPGSRPQRRRRRRPGDDRRQGLRPRRHRPQRPAAGPRPARPGRRRHDHLVPDRRRDGTNVMALPVDAAVPAAYGARLVPPPPRAGDGQRLRVEVRADPAARLDVDNPDDLAHPPSSPPPARGCERSWPAVADDGRRHPRCRATSPVPVVGAGRRRPPRRRRVRRRRHARQVGRRRLRRPPPRLHGRLEGHVGSVRRPRRARRPPPGRAARGGPSPGRRAGRRGALPRSRRRRPARRSRDRRATSCRDHPRAAPGGRARPRSRGSATGCTPTTATPAGWSATPSSPPATRTSSPSTALATAPPGRAVAVGGRRAQPRRGRQRVRRPQARRARGPREPVRDRRCTPPTPATSTRSVSGSVPGSPSSARRTACPAAEVFASRRPLAAGQPVENWPGRRPRPAARRTPGRCPATRRRPGPRRPATTSSRWRRWVTSEAEVERRSRATRSAASSGPHAHVSPDGADELDADRRLVGRPAVGDVAERPGADADVGDVAQAVGRLASRRRGASTTSWPWAHVSISRAVMNERAPIAGPYHGTRALGSTVRASATRRSRSLRHRSSSSADDSFLPCSTDGSTPSVTAASSTAASAANARGRSAPAAPAGRRTRGG